MTSAAMAFMRDHGGSRTSIPRAPAHGTRSRTVSVRGCGRRASVRAYCVASCRSTVFLKLKDIGGNVLPPYDEEAPRRDITAAGRGSSYWRVG